MKTPVSIVETHIINLIETNAGLKGVDLVNRIMAYDLIISYNEIMDIIFDLVERGELVEIELVLPNNVSKSFLVPKRTKINIISKGFRK